LDIYTSHARPYQADRPSRKHKGSMFKLEKQGT
jgi:hypothetical protein